MSSIEEDIKRCEQLTRPEHASWIGLSNQNAIKTLLCNLEALCDMQRSADRELQRQKQINEEHQKINGELRERVKELENSKIIQDKNIRSGKPTIEGTRLTVIDVLLFMTEFIKEHEKEFRENYTDINLKQIIDSINYLLENSIPKQKIKDLKENIILQPVIVGGRRNRKTLEYGIKLGKIKACEELLQESEGK